MTEVQRPPESLYRKVINPGLDIINHANKLGIRLKSTTALRTPVPPLLAGERDRDTFTPLHGRTRSRSSLHRFSSQSQPTQYIHNVVVPLPLASNDFQQSLYRSLTATPSSYHSSKVRNNSLPVVSRGTRVSTAKTNITSKSMGTSLYTDNYLSTTPSERLLLEDNEVSTWNTSSQALRFEAEKRNVAKSRTMKRLSEIQSHRVDRMYYLAAAPAPIHAKYHFDQEDLHRLKDLSQVRRTAPHYGRGLSSSTENRDHGQQTPRPTPVANTPLPNPAEMPDENEAVEKNQQTFITQETNLANETEEAEQEIKAISDVDSLATLPAESEKDDAVAKLEVVRTEGNEETDVQSEVEEWAKNNSNQNTADVTRTQTESHDQVDRESTTQMNNNHGRANSDLHKNTEDESVNEKLGAVQDLHVNDVQNDQSKETAQSQVEKTNLAEEK